MADKTFTKFGPSAGGLQDAYRDRLEAAQQLLASERNSADLLMAQCALEIALKCRICKLLGEPNLPQAFYTHDVEGLLIAAGLRHELERPEHDAVKKSWLTIVDLAGRNVDYRYEPDGVVADAEVHDFVSNLTDPSSGVIPWIERFL